MTSSTTQISRACTNCAALQRDAVTNVPTCLNAVDIDQLDGHCAEHLTVAEDLEVDFALADQSRPVPCGRAGELVLQIRAGRARLAKISSAPEVW